MAFGDADLPVFTEGVFSVAVVYGLQRTRGTLDRTDAITTDDTGLARDGRTTVLTIATGTLTDLRDGADITADRRAYAIRQVDLADDGKLTMIHLAET